MSWKSDPDKTPEENNRMFREAVVHAHMEAAIMTYKAAVERGISEEEAFNEGMKARVSL